MPIINKPVEEQVYITISPDSDAESLLSVENSFIMELYKKNGALLFRGFSLDQSSLNTFTNRFCSQYIINNAGGRMFIDDRTQSVNLGNESFPLHSELSSEPWKADVAWFACSKPPSNGGETTICDGIEIVPRLQSDTRSLLESKQLLYRRRATKEECKAWLNAKHPTDSLLENPPDSCPFIFQRDGGCIMRSFSVPALHKPMFSQRLAFANFLLFARFYHRSRKFPIFDDGSEIPDDICIELKNVSDALTVPVKWEHNDLLMIDNTRFMHGRNAIHDVKERMILTQFGYLSFAELRKNELQKQPWRMVST